MLWQEAVGREARVAGGDRRPQSTVVVLGGWGWGAGGGSGGSQSPITCQQMALTERNRAALTRTAKTRTCQCTRVRMVSFSAGPVGSPAATAAGRSAARSRQGDRPRPPGTTVSAKTQPGWLRATL